jgi:hypothetical protein
MRQYFGYCKFRKQRPITERGHRIRQALNYLLYFICSDDKVNSGKPSALYSPRFWKALNAKTILASFLYNIWGLLPCQ